MDTLDQPDEVVFGPDAVMGQTSWIYTAGGAYPYTFENVVNIRRDFDGAAKYDGSPGSQDVASGMTISTRYTRTDPLGVDEYVSTIYGAAVEAVAQTSVPDAYVIGLQAWGVNDASASPFAVVGVLGVGAVEGSTGNANTPSLIGVWGSIDRETEYSGSITDAESIRAYATLGAVPTMNWYGVRVHNPYSGSAVTNTYGVHVDAQTRGSAWNIYSAGATTRNKFEGRVFQGAPNSAPSDADLGNGQITAYLNQAGNALTFRVRYSDTTLKTGTVALT